MIALTWDLFSPTGCEEFAVSGALQEREEIILLKKSLYSQGSLKQAVCVSIRQYVSKLLEIAERLLKVNICPSANRSS